MDTVSELLADVRARGAVFGRAALRAPWALRVVDGAALTLATPLRGRAWVVPDGGAPVTVGVGELAVVRGDVPYLLADGPNTAPTRTLTAADYCAPPRVDGDTVLLSGAFERRGGLSEQLLRTLPPVLVVPVEDDGASPAPDALAREIDRERPGQQQVLDRTLDLMLVSALRRWFDDPASGGPAWCRAMDDPVVGPALRLLYDAPARPWTVAGLASQVGVSRAALAKRFAAEVGEPPMTYLTNWRIARAADLLRQTDLTVGAIASRVGYANAYALSDAFTRVRGERPTEHRRRAAPSTALHPAQVNPRG